MSKTNSRKTILTLWEVINLLAFGRPSENGAQQWREEQVPFIKPPPQPKGAKPTRAEATLWQEYKDRQKASAERTRQVEDEEMRLTEAAMAEIKRAGEAGDFEATGKKARGHRETVPKTDWDNGRIDLVAFDPSDGGPDCDYGIGALVQFNRAERGSPAEQPKIHADGLTWCDLRFPADAIDRLREHLAQPVEAEQSSAEPIEPVDQPTRRRVGRPSAPFALIEQVYLDLLNDGKIDFKQPMSVLYPVIRERVAKERDGNRHGLGRQTLYETIRPLFERDRPSSDNP